ncbi:FmdE, Molybdenum formylmethanofuran dehydrogenase operon [Desulfacinum hydrothermale DSM 13146]|uniref:FmdE, Molybdenum formylmethanofuran dehydrogenase operon n=2 Tax=Desulfacinum hydrothermale TaxID=109258 RepID=A0A1W1XFA4_9BACT|nr:FmdE, Molybdenum formylmethanofuran dehydrogenase operon [Desulfacinum hydrothermale DSM 13146]
MERLKALRVQDHALMPIVETDPWSADPGQVLMGCSFGKGNFLFKDCSKMALSLISRRTGRGEFSSVVQADPPGSVGTEVELLP